MESAKNVDEAHFLSFVAVIAIRYEKEAWHVISFSALAKHDFQGYRHLFRTECSLPDISVGQICKYLLLFKIASLGLTPPTWTKI